MNNIGRKIKVMAGIIFGLMLFASVGSGLGFIFNEESVVGISVIVGGLLSSFFVYIVNYGFGEIIDTLKEIESNTRPNKMKSQTEFDDSYVSRVENLKPSKFSTEDEYYKAVYDAVKKSKE